MNYNEKLSVKINSGSKLYATLFCGASFLNCFVVLHDMASFVLANDLFVAFPDDYNTVTLILTIPAVFTIIFSIIAGWLLKYISTKTELIISNALACIFGIFGCAIPTAGFILFTSIMLGIAAAFGNTAGCSVLAEVFQEEGRRSRMMGYYSAAASLMGVFLTYGVGLLITLGWKHAFDIWYISLVTLILSIFFTPGIKPSQRIEDSSEEQDEQSTESEMILSKERHFLGFPTRFWTLWISALIFYTFYQAFTSYSSVYVAENQLGTSVYAGAIVAMSTLSATVIGIFLGRIFQKMRRTFNYIIYIIPIVAMIGFALIPGKVTSMVFALLIGISYGSWYGISYAYGCCCVPLAKQGMAISIMFAALNLGVTIGGLWAGKAMAVLGGITPVFKFCIIGLAAGLIFEHFCIRKDIKDRFLME